jgi:hypothetical protein
VPRMFYASSCTNLVFAFSDGAPSRPRQSARAVARNVSAHKLQKHLLYCNPRGLMLRRPCSVGCCLYDEKTPQTNNQKQETGNLSSPTAWSATRFAASYYASATGWSTAWRCLACWPTATGAASGSAFRPASSGGAHASATGWSTAWRCLACWPTATGAASGSAFRPASSGGAHAAAGRHSAKVE